MKKVNIQVDIEAKELRKKLNIKDGKDYVLTETDKQDIASMVDVPVVEKVIEKTEIIKEVPNQETAVETRDKLETLVDDERLDWTAIKGIDDYKEISKLARQPKTTNNKYYGGGARAFTNLLDTPQSYTGQAGKFPKVKSTEDGLEFGSIDLSGYVPYTGATADLDLGVHAFTGASFNGLLSTSNISQFTNDSGYIVGGDVPTYEADPIFRAWLATPPNLSEFNNDVGYITSSTGLFVNNATNGTLTRSGAGPYTLGLNLGNANTWTGTQTVSKASLGTTTTDGVVVINSTSATSGNQQVSPSFTRTGRGWKTNTTAGSQTVSVRDYVLPVQGTANPSLIFKTQFNINAGSWTDAYSYDTTTAGAGFSINTPQAQSNSTPGTTRLVSFNNTGLYTWLDFNFSGTRKSSFGANSSGELYADATAGNGLIVRISGFVYHYLSSVGLLTNGYGAFSNGVMAGGTTSPTSTLVSTGGTALKVKRITASATLDNTATKWLLDATNASACTGTPTYQCSDYNNETDCTADSSHGGNCTWFGGNDCSVYNYEYGMYGCASQSGCSVDTSSCSGAGDSFSCYAQNDSYGGSCAWNGTPNDCSVFTDETSCLAESGCGWDGSSCSGTYYTYSCDGTYNTGTCSGFYGANCSGSTVTCGQYNNSTDCGLETGCTWSSVLNATLPNIDTCLDRDYWLYNDSSTGADSVIIPYGSQTIDNTSSYTLANYKDGIHISPYITNGNCSTFGDETTCLSYSGCNWDGSACSGTYVVSKNWFVWSRT